MKISIIAGLTLLLGCVNQYSTPKQYDAPETKIRLAQCLGKEAEFFGAYWCPACIRQEKAFGPEAWNVFKTWNVFKRNYIECSDRSSPEERQRCDKEEFETIPFWKFRSGIQISGYQTLEELAEFSDCDNY